MRLTNVKMVKAIFLIFCLCMLALGLGYIWHAIPATDFTGVTPPESMNTLEGWYAFNEITGWSMSFVAIVNLSFLAFSGKKISSAKKLVFSLLTSLAISIITAAIGAEFLIHFLNL